MKINIDKIKEHPVNKEIYGDDSEEQITELAEKIKASNWIKPIVISKNNFIISGHRRVRAARILGYSEIECEYTAGDEDMLLEQLLNENAYREKTTLQKVKEGEFYFKIESKKARLRQLAGVDLGVSETQGRTNEIVAEKIGLSESSYKKARKVLNKIKEVEDPVIKWFFGESLNDNITNTAKLSNKSTEFVNEVIEKVNGDVKMVGDVMQRLEQEEFIKRMTLPSEKHQVILIDCSKRPVNELKALPVGEKSEDNSVLFWWVKPPELEVALKLINTWGFKYETAFLWLKDINFEVSDFGEILLQATKGSIRPIQMAIGQDVIQKPEFVKQMIDKAFFGSKIQITPEKGWNNW